MEKRRKYSPKKGSSDNENSFSGNGKKNELLTEKEIRLIKIPFRVMEKRMKTHQKGSSVNGKKNELMEKRMKYSPKSKFG